MAARADRTPARRARRSAPTPVSASSIRARGAPCESQRPPRRGDCNRDLQVGVDELVLGVNIALGRAPLANCPHFDADGDRNVCIDELVTRSYRGGQSAPARPEESLLYTSLTYADPAVVSFDPPMQLGGPLATERAHTDLLRPVRQRLHRPRRGEAQVDVAAADQRLPRRAVPQRRGLHRRPRRRGRAAASSASVRLDTGRRRRPVRCVHAALRHHDRGRDVHHPRRLLHGVTWWTAAGLSASGGGRPGRWRAGRPPPLQRWTLLSAGTDRVTRRSR